MEKSEPYDINFCFPVKDLENEYVRVTPFVVRILSLNFSSSV